MRTGPEVAEPAIVVMDDWQGRGAGSRLLDALVERAQEEGIWRFEAPVLAYNADADPHARGARAYDVEASRP